MNAQNLHKCYSLLYNETDRSCRTHGKEDNAYKIWSET